MKENILNLLKIWSKWGVFDDKFLFGLEATFLRKSFTKLDELNMDNDSGIDSDLKIFLKKNLDDLYKQISHNNSSLEKQCRILGLSFCGGDEKQIISRILTYFENKFYKEKEKKINFIRDEDNADKNALIEYDNVINNLKQILNSLQRSYKKIDENYIDGIKIDSIEYSKLFYFIKEVFNLNKRIEVKSELENIDGEEIIDENLKEFIDGEELIGNNDINGEKIKNDHFCLENEKFPSQYFKNEIITHEDIKLNFCEEDYKNKDYVDDIDGEPIDD